MKKNVELVDIRLIGNRRTHPDHDDGDRDQFHQIITNIYYFSPLQNTHSTKAQKSDRWCQSTVNFGGVNLINFLILTGEYRRLQYIIRVIDHLFHPTEFWRNENAYQQSGHCGGLMRILLISFFLPMIDRVHFWSEKNLCFQVKNLEIWPAQALVIFWFFIFNFEGHCRERILYSSKILNQKFLESVRNQNKFKLEQGFQQGNCFRIFKIFWNNFFKNSTEKPVLDNV